MYLHAAFEPPKRGGAYPAHLHRDDESVLGMVNRELCAGEHGVLIMDRAGWHRAKNLVVPDNITILYPPPSPPELNPVERLWGYMKSHYLGNRAHDGDDHLLNARADAWQQITPELLRSVCACPYLTPELER